jgi:hypothetical protein
VVGDMEEALEARPIHPEFELNTRGGQRCRRRPRGCRRPNTGDTRANLAHIAFPANGASYLIAHRIEGRNSLNR